jgi:hypothetical protein
MSWRGAILGLVGALLFAVAGAQQSVPVYVSDTAPSGACFGPRVWSLRTNPSQTWCCIAQTWTNCTPSGAGGSPAGTNTMVQFNDGGAFGGESGLVYDKTTDTLTALGGYVLPTYARASVPTCASGWLSKEIRVHDASSGRSTRRRRPPFQRRP